jgi:hypothetical protein
MPPFLADKRCWNARYHAMACHLLPGGEKPGILAAFFITGD